MTEGVLRPGDWLSVREALALLPVGKSMLYRLVGEGRIPAIRVASVGSRRGKWLVERAGLEAYVARLRAATTSREVKVDVDQVRDRLRRHRGGTGRAARMRTKSAGGLRDSTADGEGP